MIWANFLHIYQPPDQAKHVLKEIINSSYLKIIGILKKHPYAKLTLNITGCLTERLIKEGYKNIITSLKRLAEKGQIEFTETAKYHAFLPLLPKQEIIRQVKLNNLTNKRFFGKIYQPKGFHLPEMAYSRKVAEIVAKLGYNWLILSEISFKGKLFSKIDASKIYRLKGLPKVKILFRNRKLSDLIQRGFMNQTKDFYQFLEKEIGEDEYVITAMDGETFGHHRPGSEKFLENLYRENKIETKTISGILEIFPENGAIEPIPSSWASMESEIKRKTYYAQWRYPNNPIHKKQWELTYLAINTINKSKNDKNYKKARRILDIGLYSCQYWWGGAVPWWGIEYIEKGAYLSKKSIESLTMVPKKIKEKAQKLYYEILDTAFKWQRSGFAHKKSLVYTKRIIKELKEKIPHPLSY